MTPPPREGLWALTVDRPVATIMIVAAVAVFGALSWGLLPLNLLPDLAYPTLTLRTTYPGAAPEEVEAEVTRPIEEVLRTVEGVVDVESTSRPGLSDVVLRFHWDANMDFAGQRVRERVDVLRVPEGAEPPLLLRYDPALDPILRVGLAGDLPLATLRLIAEEDIARELEKVPGVASVRVLGGREPLVRIDLDQRRLDRYGLTPADIQQRLLAENVNLAGGQLQSGQIDYLVRTLNEFRSPEDLAQLIVASPGGVPLPLEAVADVYTDHRDREVATHIDGREAVEIAVFKEADANLVQTAQLLKDRLLGDPDAPDTPPPPPPRPAGKPGPPQPQTLPLARTLPPGAALTLLSDPARYVEAAIDEVLSTALLGALLAVLVLYVFLRSPWSTSIIAVAIPLSVIATFAPMRLFGTSLNLMSLGGLALGTGMLVDNSIVVLESIFRCREEGDSIRDAAIRGVREVGGAVVASTLTTTAVFLPLIFVEGIAGPIFTDLAFTVISSLLASLAVALAVVPMLAALQLQRAPDDDAHTRTRHPGWRLASLAAARDDLRAPRPLPLRALLAPWILLRTALLLPLELLFAKLLGGLLALTTLLLRALLRALAVVLRAVTAPPLWLFDRAFHLLTQTYARLLAFALRARLLTLAITAALLALALFALQRAGAELLPTLHQGEFQADLQLPIGTSLQDTEAAVTRIEQRLDAVDGLDSSSASIGAELDSISDADRGPHSATLHLRLRPARDIQAAEDRAADQLRRILRDQPGVQAELKAPTLFSLQTPVQVTLQGYNLDLLQQSAATLTQRLQAIPGVQEVRASTRAGHPEVRIAFDRDALASRNLDLRQTAEVVRAKVQGTLPSQLRQDQRRVDIQLRLRRDQLRDLDALRDLVVAYHTPPDPNALPIPITLGAVAHIELREGPAEIRHADGQRAALLHIHSDSLDLDTLASRVQATLDTTPLPPGFSAHLGGQNQELQDARRSLLLALALAIFLVYVIMASQFESLLAPLIIIGSVPLAVIGVAFALDATHTPLSVVVFIGLIMLAGIVVNNAIVLIDYILQQQARGLPRREAIQQACAVRLRPVLMTTLTTILGLLPLALGLGEGAELRAPLALTVIAGLASSTLLTLLVIPVLFDTLYALRAPPAP